MWIKAVLEKRGRLIGWSCLATAAMLGGWLARSWVPAVGIWLTDWWPLPVTIMLAGIGVTVLEARRRASPSARPSNGQDDVVSTPLSTRIIVAWSIAIGIAGAIAVAVLLRAYGHGEPRDQLDAIRTAGTIVLGTGGAAALLLTARRQRSTELTLAHQRKVAAATEADATARRITELYTKAVEQLGSDKAPVRLGGLYALERLAQDNPDQQQTIVNVICAYLRMPYVPPSTSPRRLGIRRPLQPRHPRHDATRSLANSQPSADSSRQELEVRLAAQQILTDHLNPGPTPAEPVATFWKDINVNLTGATLVDFNLANCSMLAADFRSARFSGDAWFDKAQFNGHTRFAKVQFNGHAWFDKAQFNGGDARFDETQFNGRAIFNGSQFNGHAWFGGAQFTGRDVGFTGAEFNGHAWFREAQFTGRAGFVNAQFTGGEAGFDDAQFSGDAWFEKAQFTGGAAKFKKVRFNGRAGFDDTQFSGDAWFEKAQFNGRATFNGAQFNGHAAFFDTKFNGRAVFVETQFNGDARFGKVRFNGHAWFGRALFNGETGFGQTVFIQPPDLEGARFEQDPPPQFASFAQPAEPHDHKASHNGTRN